MEILLSVILGWLLGILSPGIIDRISNKYKKRALLQIIISDLKDIRKRLALLPLRVNPAYGAMDKKLLIWLKTQTLNYTDIESEGSLKKFLESLDAENEDDLTKLVNYFNSSGKKDNPAFHFKKMVTSIIDSNLINIGVLDNKFLPKLLEIKFQINVFNEEINNVNELLKMTFDSNISNANYQIIKTEIDKKNMLISEKAIYIVNKINTLIDTKNKI